MKGATDEGRRWREKARRLRGLAGALSLAFTVGVMSSPARASGIPTVDAAALTQRIQTILQLNEQYQTLKDQYSKMKEQFSELQHIKSNLNGIDGVMEALGALDETLRIGEGISDFAATADSLLAPQGSGAGVLAGDDKARQVYNAAGLGARCEGYTRADLKAICQRQGAGQAKLTAQIYESLSKLKDHFDAVDRIYSRAQGAQTQKAMTDALEAMQTQKALIALEQSRVQSYVQGMAALQVTNKLQQEAAVKNMFVMKPEQATSARARQILRTN
ncbi:MAG: hypothetical protein IJ228_12255 [Succinivibrio sp.]|nr:hypothetical protein [Succinivibrio sp.]